MKKVKSLLSYVVLGMVFIAFNCFGAVKTTTGSAGGFGGPVWGCYRGRKDKGSESCFSQRDITSYG